ncbi:DUF4834 family protein [uncultured Tenacibaculum sp.]|uniref:DUF4834 family protein n=1 Tax=uncultured Tenacibaculum sp. TaxID=174713 RepID=UPI0026297490|nr:DUF4834 family protein [uncultured Tenacibaculum sp.]
MNIQEAGPINMIRTILIILVVYYALRFLMKLFAPFLVKKAMDKMQQKAEQQYQNQNRQNDSTVNEGETVIDKKPQNTKQSNNSVGEYVDFEELD